MRTFIRLVAILTASVLIALLLSPKGLPEKVREATLDPNNWQRLASPGELSRPHAFLEGDCAACHSPVEGIRSESCVVCHANAEAVLQRQPTAFHADVQSCVECHLEHRGRGVRPTDMQHSALVTIGMRSLSKGAVDTEGHRVKAKVTRWIHEVGGGAVEPAGSAKLSPQEVVLNCASCHKNDDRHFDLFGADCSRCHATDAWNIPEYTHPPANSRDCSQCHQAPPSHYMGHFKMISATVAGRPNAPVSQCQACHLTTSWPDIKQVGWYKHH